MVRLLLVFFLCAVAVDASAFDSWEHKRLSDLAYHLAVEIHCPDNSDDETCAELRPETTVDVTRQGVLAIWCDTESVETEKTTPLKKSICIKLHKLYFTHPEDAYAKSRLSKICGPDGKNEPVCADVKKLLNASPANDPVSYSQRKEVLRWCIKNRGDEICKYAGTTIKSEAQLFKGIVRDCFAIGDPAKCEFKVPTWDERLSWASFFDPLARNVDLKHRYENDSNLTYGDVTKCVDYFLTPDKLMAGSETALWYPTEDKQITSRSRLRGRQLYPSQREDLDLSVTRRCDDSYWNLEGARSGHVNHTHFQAELLISQRSQHLLALSLHAVEGNRMAALTANAISDHYLHDSFAPGHITTWRSRLTDLAANAYHDARNRKGLYVSIDRDRFNEMMKDADGSGLYNRVFDLVRRDTKTSRSDVVRAYFLYPDQNYRDCARFRCIDGAQARDVRTEVRSMEGILQKLIGKLQKADDDVDPASQRCDNTHCVMFHGDGQLWAPSQDEQRLMLLLVQVRSILDILESAPRRTDRANQYTITDSFRQETWAWHALEEESSTVWERAIHPPASYLVAKVGPVNYQISQSVDDDPKYIHQYQFFDPVFGISFGFDNMTFGDQQNRWTLAFEKVVFGMANEKRDSMNFAAVAGVEKLFEPTSNGYGLTSRLSLVFPQTETIFSLSVREIRIGSIDSYKRWRPTYGIRVDQGFTSFATMFFQISRDAAAQKSGRIDSGVSVGAGVQIAAPKCRIPLINNICR